MVYSWGVDFQHQKRASRKTERSKRETRKAITYWETHRDRYYGETVKVLEGELDAHEKASKLKPIYTKAVDVLSMETTEQRVDQALATVIGSEVENADKETVEETETEKATVST